MDNTFEKLSEAQYFLDRMIALQANRLFFKYNLSAFLSAFRSVTFFMQKEYSGMENFAKWYSLKQSEFEANKEMQLLNTKRVMTIHKVPVGLHANINGSIHERIFITDHLSVEIIHADGTIEKEKPINIERIELTDEIASNEKWLWYFDDYTQSDVVSICSDCMTYLSNVVSDCSSTCTQ